MYQRAILSRLNAALADTPVVLLHGARQTGKTTLARLLAAGTPKRRYLTFDDSAVLGAAAASPAGFLAGLDGPVVLDEVQRVPELFPAIKAQVDTDRTPGRFLLTGSANVLLVPKVSESLAGRIDIITLWPLSQNEIEGVEGNFVDRVFAARLPALHLPPKPGLTLTDRIVRGGYPEPLSRSAPERRAAWYSSYLTTILQRDIRDLANIEGLSELPRLLALLASRASGLLNVSDLSRSLSIPMSTLKRYFALLEATFLVVLLPAWSSNLGLRLSKSPKVLLADTGLACHLLGLDGARLRNDGNARGALVENFVAMEIIKQASWSRTGPKVLHFRTAAGREADIVLESAQGRIVGIEVKASSSVGAEDFKGLRALAEAAGDRFVRGVVLYDGAEPVSFDKNFVAQPIRSIWAA